MHQATEKVNGSPSRASRLLVKGLTGLAIALVGVVALLVAATTLPGLIGLTPVVVLSGSMEPALRVGDIAVVRKVDPTTVGLGDVVTYRSGSNLTTHRIIRVVDTPQGRQFEMKGDNNATPDVSLVSESQVVAKVVYGVPKVGYLANFVNSVEGITLFIITPAVILALVWYRKRREKRARSPTKEAPMPSPRIEAR